MVLIMKILVMFMLLIILLNKKGIISVSYKVMVRIVVCNGYRLLWVLVVMIRKLWWLVVCLDVLRLCNNKISSSGVNMVIINVKFILFVSVSLGFGVLDLWICFFRVSIFILCFYG